MGTQEDPFAGDVINSYNDGPVEDGSIMDLSMKLKRLLLVRSWLPVPHWSIRKR